MRGKVRLFAAGAAFLAVAGMFVAAGAGGAGAAGGGGPTPPWESSVTPNGFITFYNAEGQVVTGGSITASGLGVYAVASTADLRSGDDEATLYIYTPVNGTGPGAWSGSAISGASSYPSASAPEPISSTANPVETNSGDDESIASYITAFPNTDTSTTDGYAGLYDVRLYVSGPGLSQETSYWDTVISVDVTAGTITDPTAGTWTVDYPDYTQNTTTTLSASPGSPQTAPASPITLTANVVPAAAGTVSFWSGGTQVATAQTVTATSGQASVTTTPSNGTTTYTAIYTPDVGSSDIGSSTTLTYTVEIPLDETLTTLSETGGGGAAGTPVDLTATVSDYTNPASTPTGTVSFYDNGSSTPLATVTLSDGTAVLDTSFAAGSQSVVAEYNPPVNGVWASSESASVTFLETAPVPDTTSTSLSETGGGGTAGTPVDFTATVTDVTNPANNPVTAGTVSFYETGSATALGTVTATSGTNPAEYEFSTTFSAGSYSVYAMYSPPAGSTEYAASTSASVTFTEAVPVPVFTADSPPLTAGTGTPYSYQFSATYATGYTVGGGAPSWLSVSSDGLVSGTPPAGTKSFTYSVTASDSSGSVTTGRFTVSVSPDADVSVKLSCPASLAVGATGTCTITVANAGPALAENVAAAAVVLAPLTVTGCSSGCVRLGGLVGWLLAPLAAGQADTLTITVKAESKGTAAVAVGAAALNPDPNLLNNAASAEVAITG